MEDIDGHDIEELLEVLSGVGLDDKPLAIIAKTYKGAGISFLQDKEGWHGKPLNKEEAIAPWPNFSRAQSPAWAL